NQASPVEMVKEARLRGLDGIAITDHNSFKSWDSLKKLRFDDFVIIPGEEISTIQGHLLALGITEEIKPGQDVFETIDQIHQQGGISIAPHPFDLAKKGIKNLSRFADGIEVFNAMCLDKFANLRALKYAEKLNRPQVAGTDAHQKEWVGCGITKIDCDFDLDIVLKELISGNTRLKKRYVSVKDMTDWYLTRLNKNPSKAMTYIDKNHGFLKKALTKSLMKHSARDNIYSRGVVNSLSNISLAGSITHSFFVNYPKCLI
ncbi:MAG: hypothetical protein DRP06_03825, partial [Candidatus Aenigmatarchaeota archaeon]